MLKNYIKLAYRNLWKSKVFSTINILGLAIGIAASFMMFLIVFHELSYDQHIPDKEKVGRIISDNENFELIEASASLPLATVLKESYPEIEKLSRTYRNRIRISINGTDLGEKTVYHIDPDMIDILSIKFKKGNKNIFASAYNATLLSESEAQRLFPKGDCIGKTIDIESFGNDYQLTVVGIYEDILETSTFNSSILISMEIGEKIIDDYWTTNPKEPIITNWSRDVVGIYMKFNKQNAMPSLEEKLVDVSEKNVPDYIGKRFKIQKLEDIYFGSNNLIRNVYPHGDSTKTTIFTIVAFLILLIASLNYVILTIAKSIKRNKEIGIRKVIGATRRSIILQVVLESNLISFVALPFAALIFEVCLIPLTNLLGVEIHETFYKHYYVIIAFVAQAFFVASLTGLYISIHLSRLKPIELFKRKVNIKSSRIQLRQVFIAVELIIVVVLLFSIIVVKEQIFFFRNKDMGFDKNNLFVIEILDENWHTKYDVIKSELLNLQNVENVTAAAELPPIRGGMLFRIPKHNNPNEEVTMNNLAVDFDFLETFDIELIEGRNFSKEYSTDSTKACLMNETAIKELGLGSNKDLYEGNQKIIGVIKDINFRSFHTKISPMMIGISKTKYLYEIVVKIKGTDLVNSVSRIKDTIENIIPNTKYETHFYDERIDYLYKEELNFATILNVSTGLAIFITCLGLFGLTLFIAEQRTKEIGIRKVLGASVTNIVKMISKEFVILVVIGSLIASPIAYYSMQKWLDNFAYKIEIGIDTFLLAGFVAMAITLTTISIQAVKVALANPVESLRDE